MMTELLSIQSSEMQPSSVFTPAVPLHFHTYTHTATHPCIPTIQIYKRATYHHDCPG